MWRKRALHIKNKKWMGIYGNVNIYGIRGLLVKELDQ